MSTLPDIDDAYIRLVFDNLSNMQVDLDGDPLVFGPKRLNAKVAQCREHLSRCQQIYLQLADHLHQLARASRQAKLDFDIKAQDLLANDPEVKSQRAIRDREAVVSSKLRVERETNHLIETAITDLESVIMVVKAKREDLKDIQGRIRDQVKLCQEEIALGSKWGSAPPPGVRMDLDVRPRVDTTALSHFNDVVGGLDGESSISDLSSFVRDELVARGEPAPVAPVTSVEEEEEFDLDAMLGATKEPTPAPVVVQMAPLAAAVFAAVDAALAEEPFVLPAVESTAPAHSPTATDVEVDSFLGSVDTSTDTKKKAAPVSSDDFDIDDLIGEFVP